MTLKRFGAGAWVVAACLAVTAYAEGRPQAATSSAHVVTSTQVYSFGVVGSGQKLLALKHDTPTPVAGISGEVIQVASSNSDGYALTSGGTVWAWGAGARGELGDGSRPRYVTAAVRVDFPAGVKIVALPNPMPFDGALAIDSRGDVWGWGRNGSGDLCLRGAIKLRPTRIPLTRVTLATGARTHSLFYSHGKLYGCGSGDAGELGDGSKQSSFKPTLVRDLPPQAGPIVALTSSWEGSGALFSDGAYYDWGFNRLGQLGDGRTIKSDVPVHVRLPGPVRQVFQGGSNGRNGQTLAILRNGSVWGWGAGHWGQLGDGSTTDSRVPVQVEVPAGVSFVQINSGGYCSYAIDGAARLWAWGANNLGQLGTGSNAVTQTTPIEVGLHLTQISSTATNVVGLDSR